jgi:outer membrane lipoprotein SlyB
METTTRKLHPLLTAAAISVTVFSVVGVAAMTGLIPHSKSQEKETAPVAALEAPAPKAEAMPAAEAPPAPKPVKKHVAKAKPAAPKPVEAVAYNNDFSVPQVSQAPQTIETPKPVVKPGVLGTVESVREVEVPGEAKGVGAVAGGVAGAVLGHQIKHDSKLATILGAAGGAFVGNATEKHARITKHWEMTVRFDDGTRQTTTSETQPFWHQGDRVRLLEGKLQPV